MSSVAAVHDQGLPAAATRPTVLEQLLEWIDATFS